MNTPDYFLEKLNELLHLRGRFNYNEQNSEFVEKKKEGSL